MIFQWNFKSLFMKFMLTCFGISWCFTCSDFFFLPFFFPFIAACNINYILINKKPALLPEGSLLCVCKRLVQGVEFHWTTHTCRSSHKFCNRKHG